MIAIDVLASSSSGNCYRVTDGSTPLLLECGVGLSVIQRAARASLFEVLRHEGCLISHEHQDHCKSVETLMHFGVDCYMSQGTAGALGVTGHRVRVVQAKKQFHVGSWTVLPFNTEHDAAEPLGFLLVSGGEKLLYLTDSYYCRYNFVGLSHIMVECNYARDILDRNVESGAVPAVMAQRLRRSHFSLGHVKGFLRANNLSAVREIHLIHLSDGNSDAARFKREIQELTGKPVYVAER